jgi:hypothetical protein
LEPRAFMKRFISLQFLNLRESVGLHGQGISLSQGWLLRFNKHLHVMKRNWFRWWYSEQFGRWIPALDNNILPSSSTCILKMETVCILQNAGIHPSEDYMMSSPRQPQSQPSLLIKSHTLEWIKFICHIFATVQWNQFLSYDQQNKNTEHHISRCNWRHNIITIIWWNNPQCYVVKNVTYFGSKWSKSRKHNSRVSCDRYMVSTSWNKNRKTRSVWTNNSCTVIQKLAFIYVSHITLHLKSLLRCDVM